MNWIKKSHDKSKSLRDHYKLYDIDIFIKDKLPENINLDFCLKYVSKFLPLHMLKGVDIIYIGQFDFLNKRDVNAVYKDGAIYITNVQDDDYDIINDIIHEISHSVEENYQDTIYGDGRLVREFLGKRTKLYYLLKSEQLKPSEDLQTTVEFNQEIDDYLYNEVGYRKLWNIVTGLFLGPYSVTSLREYFARGFEEYVLGEKNDLKTICPVLYDKLETLYDMEQ
tara:strand:- start:827 stop:1498 length:672 start_codon:yes stop_codon:yes gene_type:complete